MFRESVDVNRKGSVIGDDTPQDPRLTRREPILDTLPLLE